MHKRSIKKHMAAVTAAALTISSVPAVPVYANDLPEISVNGFSVSTTDSVTTKSGLTDGAEFTLTYSGNIGNVTYAVTEGSAATVNSATGEVDFTEYGTVTVTATDANNDAESTSDDIKASITLTVEQAQLITITPTISEPEKDIVIEDSDNAEDAVRNAVTVSFTDGSGNTVPLDESDYVLNFEYDDTLQDSTYSYYYVTVSLTDTGAEKYNLSGNGSREITVYYIQEVTANISAETVTVPLGATEEQIKEAIKADIKNGKVSFTYEKNVYGEPTTETAEVDSYELNVVDNGDGTYTVSVASVTADRYRLVNDGSKTISIEYEKLAITPTINKPEKDIVIEKSDDSKDAIRNAVTVSFTDGSGNTVPLDESDYVLNFEYDQGYDPTYTDYYVTVSLTEAGAEKYNLSGNGRRFITVYYIVDVTANISAETVTVPLGATEEQIKEAITNDIKNGKVSFTYEKNVEGEPTTVTAEVDSYELNVVKNDNGTYTVSVASITADRYRLGNDGSKTISIEYEKLAITPTINKPEKAIVIEYSDNAEDAVRNAVTVSFTDGSGNTVPLDESDYVLNFEFSETYDPTYSDYYVTVSLTEAGAEKYNLSGNGIILIAVYYFVNVTANISADTVTVPITYTEEQIKEAIKADIKNGKVSFTYERIVGDEPTTVTADVDSYELNVVNNGDGTYTVSVASITADRYKLGNGGSATVTVEFEKLAITPTISKPEKDIIVETAISEDADAAVRNAVTVSFTDGSGNTVTLTKDVDYTLNVPTIELSARVRDVTIDVSVELTEAAKEKYTLSSDGSTPINVYLVIYVQTDFEDNITVSVPSNATEAQIIAAIKENVFPSFYYLDGSGGSYEQKLYVDVDSYELNVVKNDNGTYTVSVTSITADRYRLSISGHETATVTVEFEKLAITPTINKPEKDIIVESTSSEDADAAVRNAVTVSFTDESGKAVTLTKDVDYTLNVPIINWSDYDITIDVSVELTEAAKEKYTLSSDGSTPINVYLAIRVKTDFEDNITVSVPSNATEAQIIAAIKENVFPRFYYWSGSGGSYQEKNYTDVDSYELDIKKNDDGTYTVSVTSITADRYRLSNGGNETATVTVEFAETEYDNDSAEITLCEAMDSQVALNWSEVEGAQKYAIYMWSKNGGVNCVGTRNSGVTGAYINGLTNGTKYGFLVRTYNGERWSDYEASDWVYAVPFSIPKPSITKCIGQTGRAALNWSAVDGAEQYAIYTYINGVYTCVGGRAAGVTGMYVRNLESGKRYGFLVRAKVNGQWSSYTTADIAYADIL